MALPGSDFGMGISFGPRVLVREFWASRSSAFREEVEEDSGNGSPRRWGWGIPLKKTIRHPNREYLLQNSQTK